MLPRSNIENKPLIIAVVGPTTSGKSALAVELARKFNGEIISADSRQVYKGMDIGSGKITKREMHKVPHYLLDVASPHQTFTVARYQTKAHQAIRTILKHNKLPIICGGTGLYIDAALYDTPLPLVKPNPKLRASLEKLDTETLFKKLEKLDPARARNIDKHNRRRLIRALEIVIESGKQVPPLQKKQSPYRIIWFGITRPTEELHARIHTRLITRIKQGMVAEVRRLRGEGLSSKRLESFGLEYRYTNRLIEGKYTKQEYIEILEAESHKYSNRQMTWFKRNKEIFWIKNTGEAERLLRESLGKKTA